MGLQLGDIGVTLGFYWGYIGVMETGSCETVGGLQMRPCFVRQQSFKQETLCSVFRLPGAEELKFQALWGSTLDSTSTHDICSRSASHHWDFAARAYDHDYTADEFAIAPSMCLLLLLMRGSQDPRSFLGDYKFGIYLDTPPELLMVSHKLSAGGEISSV